MILYKTTISVTHSGQRKYRQLSNQQEFQTVVNGMVCFFSQSYVSLAQNSVLKSQFCIDRGGDETQIPIVYIQLNSTRISMKLFYTACIDFYKRNNKLPFWGLLFLFLAVSFVINDLCGINDNLTFKKSYIPFSSKDHISHYFKSILFYMVPVYFTFILYCTQFKKTDLLRDIRIWGLLLAVIAIFSLSIGFTHYRVFFQEGFDNFERRFILLNLDFFTRTIVLILILLWYKRRYYPDADSFFFFDFKSLRIKQYIPLITLLVIGIFLFSYEESLYKYYPQYYQKIDSTVLGLSFPLRYIIYEAVYLFQFYGVELFFRGFILWVLHKKLGDGAIFISSAMYYYIHFSKPPLEIISSFFGGLILCIIVMRTKSIWTGIIFHITIAFSMDTFGLLQRTLIR